MAVALGMVEVLGIPTALEVADAMCKGASVTLVGFENTDLGRITVLIRGAVAEVEVAVQAGLAAIAQVNGGELLSHHIIAQPHDNLEAALPICRSADLRTFAQPIRFPPPLSA
ncbi:MAG: carbon dioxide-concentrating mechanism protein CcmK [Synechococcales cyanobacterium C42_A2020_086]|jgi:carbon dioxide concentrating mechanism protein CcmK|nr:carbon dioxide-concentrating mechanism protein CcmK [Synechococcales cyanobacterium M58_A2018_015]MBF2072636.1 carbon dioxide-concentrating mechanism protein CcmK [Synechococcales cyanobacterium C42_A2020_086]